ncbi:MAG: hypothetical protein ALECFALPRED_003461 [Alectoria fallacina]|uniref:BZIP domain-containing protein n=1 Tax=Alectoria fallacina TaxID=1903189 RepID=A0A8H3FKZ4_9LECA|nr:MAG: hypothetical protein ALECFALPRED_003461 [Alectoria fallacina]
MDGYKARKAPNVSHYLANLNALPSANEVATQQQEDFNIEDELAQFTNTEFLDFDAGDFLEQPMSEYDPGLEDKARRENAAANNKVAGKGMDFVSGDFPFSGIDPFVPTSPQSAITAPIHGLQPALYPSSPSPISFDQAFNLAPYPGQKHPLSPPPAQTPTAHPNSNPFEPETPAARLAAEEDKRRRNTAASARFRVKKKQREQALEQSAKDLENKTLQLEQRIGQLETENEWLRGLVVEKNGGVREDLKVQWKNHGGERKGGAAKKGVGTEEEEQQA